MVVYLHDMIMYCMLLLGVIVGYLLVHHNVKMVHLPYVCSNGNAVSKEFLSYILCDIQWLPTEIFNK